MKTNKPLRVLVILILVMLNIGCDQVSKSIVRQKLPYNANISFLHNRFTLIKVENPGAFLSLGDHFSANIRYVILIALPLLALIMGLVFLLTKADLEKIPLVALCFVIGGGIGNIYDRIAHGSVTDFLHIDFYLFQTGIFNMADVSVTTGMLMIFFYIVLKHNKTATAAS